MNKIFRMTLSAAFVALCAFPAQAADQKEQQLIAVLTSDAPKAQKAITCKQLAIYGTKDAVPALATFLPDEQLTSWARIALEAIPGAEADAALREALGKVKGRTLVGVINSVGIRRDAGAIDALAALVKDADAEVVAAAAAALGAIGNAPAAAVLAQTLAAAPAGVRSAVAEGCNICAENLRLAGKSGDSAKLFDQVRKADVSTQRVVEATRGSILARQAEGAPLLAEQLASPNKALFAVGLTTARELPGPQVTAVLAAALERTPPDRQALLLMALADRNDPSVLPSILQAAKSGSTPHVREAAIGVLSRVGNASCVPVLLEAAMQPDAEMARTATTALEELPGKDIDADLAARLPGAEGKMRELLLRLAGRRRIEAAVPTLIKAADDADAGVRTAALAALGLTIGPRDVAFLIARVTNPRNTEEAEAAEKALHAACIRMPDREACAAQLTDALWNMPTTTKSTVLKKRWESAGKWVWVPVSPRSTIIEVLGAMGGATALKTVREAAADPDAELQERAIYVLGQWLTTDAAPVLLELARTVSNPQSQSRALQGYVRIARDFELPDAQRAEMCRAVLTTAKRDEDKKVVFAVMQKHPGLDMLKVAAEAAKVPALKDDAAKAALAMAQKLGGNSADVRALLAQVGQDPVKVEILKAQYGTDAKWVDVTEALRRHVRDFPLIILPSPNYNASFGGDPVPGIVKQLKIQYKLNGKDGEVSLAEDAPVLLPVPK